MSYTAFTAIIITFHHLSAILAIILTAIMGAISYWIFAKGRKKQLLIGIIGFLVSLVLGIIVADALFQRKPVSFEIVQAG